MGYTLLENPKQHTCWDNPEWDGLMQITCEGCLQAEEYPCEFCGYGHIFTTHNDVAHAENGDLQVPFKPSIEWHDSPHIYERSEHATN